MGEHGTWTDFLYKIPGWAHFEQVTLKNALSREAGEKIFPSHFTMTHVWWGVVVFLIVAFGAVKFSNAMRRKDAIVPPANFGLRAVFEGLADATWGTMVGVLGEKNARRFFPLIGSLAIFIFFSNLMALVPGAGVPTTTLKTNVCLGLLVFFATHYYGVKEHGIAYFKHFLGPSPVLAPLMLPIEIISHLARPMSLSVRLMGNMAADHKVVFTFFSLVPFFVPIPFMVLGLLVCVVQTFVFCLLSTIYISMAIAHDH